MLMADTVTDAETGLTNVRQFFYIIGQTDTLLSAIDEPLSEWDYEKLTQYRNFPEHELSEIGCAHLLRYSETSEKSKEHVECRIQHLEQDKERKSRARSREKQMRACVAKRTLKR